MGCAGSRILREIWVTDFAWVLRGKGAQGAPLLGIWVYDCVDREEATMRTPMHCRTERGRHFQAHPHHATFSLVASMLLAGLVVLALVLSAR